MEGYFLLFFFSFLIFISFAASTRENEGKNKVYKNVLDYEIDAILEEIFKRKSNVKSKKNKFINGYNRMEGSQDLPDWNSLSANFPLFTKLPMNESQAIKEGWQMRENACKDDAFFVGRQYLISTDKTRMLLFDEQQRVAGIQMSFPETSLSSSENHVDGAIIEDTEDPEDYVMTAYFTDPTRICDCDAKPRRDNFVGENLFILVGRQTVMVPLEESGLAETKWVKGQCFSGMGTHYWYNISSEMSCDDFFPFFLLYNGGKLNGFGFVVLGEVISTNLEYPPISFLGVFFESSMPTCLANEQIVSTQHVYFQGRDYYDSC